MWTDMRHLLVALIILISTATAHAESSPLLKIGFILPLSGDLAFLGAGIKDAALLAKADIERQGGKLELIFEDNHGELTGTTQSGSKLISSDRVNAIITIISGVGSILKPIAAKFRILHIGICSDPEVADGEFNFINDLTAEQGVSRYLKQFRADIGSEKSLAVIQANESGFERIVKELQKGSENNPHIVELETFNKGTNDFRGLLLRVKKNKPDAILLLGLSPEIEQLARQARSIGITAPFTSIEGFGLAHDKAPFEGSWFIDSAIPNKDFKDRFESQYGRPITPGTGHAYDTVRMIYQSFKPTLSGTTLASNFRAIINFPGVIGNLNVQSNGVVWSEPSVKRIIKGMAE